MGSFPFSREWRRRRMERASPNSRAPGKRFPRLPRSAPKRRRRQSPSNWPAPAQVEEQLKVRLGELRKRGFNRLYQRGKIVEFAAPESLLDLDFTQPVFALVDRLVVSAENRARIVDSAETGYRESGEIVYEIVAAGGPQEEPKQLRFSQAFECKSCHKIYRDPEPRLFSFNNPYGACPRCQGFGNTLDFDLDLIIPDKARTLDDGAIEPWTRAKYRAYQGELRKAARQHGIPLDVPWGELTEKQREFVLDGKGAFPGVHGFFATLSARNTNCMCA